jgi:hypothetical protein
MHSSPGQATSILCKGNWDDTASCCYSPVDPHRQVKHPDLITWALWDLPWIISQPERVFLACMSQWNMPVANGPCCLMGHQAICHAVQCPLMSVFWGISALAAEWFPWTAEPSRTTDYISIWKWWECDQALQL